VIDALHRDGKIRNYEVELLKKDGTVFHALLNEDLVKIDEQYLNFAIIKDITQQRLAEEALRDERDRAQLYLDIAGVIFVALDKDAKIVLLNAKGCEILGVRLEDALGMNWIENFVPEKHREEVRQSFSRLMSGDIGEFQTYENPILTSTGDERTVKWFNTILKDENGNIVGTLSSGEDITIAKQVQDALRQSEEQYRITLESMNDAVHVIDKNLHIILMNKAVERLAASVELDGDLMYKRLDEAFPFLSESTTEEYQQIFQSGKSQQKTEHSWVKGHEVYTDVSRIPIRADGEVRYVLTVIRDMTEQYRAEANTLRAADTAMLYLDLMGHDIRNQLQAISMGVEFLHHMDLGLEATSILDYVKDTIHRSVALITKIHATEELLVESHNPTSLIASLKDSISIMRETYPDVEFDQDIHLDSATVLAGQYLTYLLMNIFENGIVHNPSEWRRIWVSLRESGAGYLLSIADNGPGLTDDSKENLFDPNRRFGGIGVHQAKKISERYNIILSVHDRIPDAPSEGAEFRLWIPRAV
ncbi:MAG: PAS domain S-box protein, partial [Candidatus Thorarchaeota archaeon]